uniref:Plant heme peroxidase family profile domain-containing protein n=1 Tax=Leersia perrieri TaxID=77586 RepID=A0A0D9X9X3_9ORYZ
MRISPAAAASLLPLLLLLSLLAAAPPAEARRHKDGIDIDGEKMCDRGWECSGSRFCCNETITDYFKAYQFEELFANRNDPRLAHAAGFWDYHSFITAAALFEPRGFGTTGGRATGMREVAAFLGHVGAKTSCGYSVAPGGPLAWGLCYNHELSPSQSYCDNSNELYPCVEGVEYYGRGALPVYWNFNYGIVGLGIKQDLLNHPELLEQNATLAFEAAIWRWMTPMKRKQPSAHDVFVGNWKPTKNDTLSKRYPGFGATMNILYGDLVCGQGSIDKMNVIVSHYRHYLDLMGVGSDNAGDNLDCADQSLLAVDKARRKGMELTNLPHIAASSRFFSSCSRCNCRVRRTGKIVIGASATGSRCSNADSACSYPIEQQNADFLPGPRSSLCYRRRDFASVALLPFILPHVNIASAAESIDGSVIQSGVRNVLSKVKAAGMLRLAFHDAGTFDIADKSGGMNGSIIYEVDRPENTGLNKSIKVLRKAKEVIDGVQQVSWADLIAVAGAESVALCGGPEIPVRLGRLDSSTADPTGKLPEETLDATALKTLFSKKGFSTQEMVVLSGAHTIGGKGFGNPNVFDNAYFKVLLEKPQPSSSGMPAMVGLRTDWALTEDDECLRWINLYAQDQTKFFADFKDAYIKLSLMFLY